MITPADIRKQAERAYPEFLLRVVTGEPFFPFEIRFGKRLPRGDYHAYAKRRNGLLTEAARVVEQSAANDAARLEAADLDPSPTAVGSGASQGGEENGGTRRRLRSGAATAGRPRPGYTVELAMHDSRRYGTQALPVRIYFPEETDYTVFLGRGHEVRRFREAIEKTRRHVPELVPWLEHHAPRAVSHLEAWNGLLLACRYFLDHPRPNLYLRQLPLAVDTKFIEEHAGILRQMLDAVLPEESVDRQAPDFERRFGLRYDEPLVRIRLLDERLPECAGWPSDDVTLPVSALLKLVPSACTLVISENKMTFLTLPAVERGAALWGGGFRVDVLRDVPWLRACRVFYWGDLDAQGFMILSRLRSFLPEARSLMMDVDTFETFREFAVPGTPTEAVPLPNLSPEESAVFESLARTNLRLEQERIPQAYVAGRLAQDVGAS